MERNLQTRIIAKGSSNSGHLLHSSFNGHLNSDGCFNTNSTMSFQTVSAAYLKQTPFHSFHGSSDYAIGPSLLGFSYSLSSDPAPFQQNQVAPEDQSVLMNLVLKTPKSETLNDEEDRFNFRSQNSCKTLMLCNSTVRHFPVLRSLNQVTDHEIQQVLPNSFYLRNDFASLEPCRKSLRPSSYISRSQKRQPEDGKEGNNPDEKRLCRPSLRSVMLEAVRLHDVQRILEPLVRKIVKEEIEVALRKHLTSFKQNCIRQVHSSTSRSLQLQFSNKLSLPVFTGTKLEAEECSAISLALIDTLSGQVVISGSESLAKVEIVVLEGDFGGDEQENWTTEEFSNNIVKEREGKRSLLTGDAFLNLSDGTGVVGDLVFTDNSSWTRSRKFRLGARIIDGNSDGVTIKEAKTEPFMVKDHRGELYKKHYPPSLTDEVWRLEKIGKDGAFHKRLRSQNINTVKDFLTLLCIDTPRLRNILGTGMSAKMWEVTVDHARTCTLDNRMYAYYPLGAQKRLGVVFNIVGQVLGLLAEEKFVPIDELSDTEKADAHKLVQVAYERWEEVGPWEDGAVMGDFLLSPAVCFPSSSTGVESSYSNQLTSSQKSDDLGFNQSVFSSDVSSILSVGGPARLNNYTLQGTSDMDLRYPQSSNMPDQVTHTLMSDMESMLHTFCGDDHLQYFDTEDAFRSQSLGLESQSDLQSAVSGFLVMSAQPAGAASVIAQTHWRILYSVLRWIFKIRRIVNSKKASKKRK